MREITFINEETVSKLLTWDSTLQAIETAMESVAKNRAVQNARSFTLCASSDSLLLTMPAYLDNSRFGALGCKLVTATPNNANLQNPLPTVNAHIMLFDEATGILKAIIGGSEITKWRTTAASVAATKYLKPSKNFKVLAILGAGAQGRVHAMAFQHFFNFKEIRIWNRTKARAEQLVFELNKIYKCDKFKHFESNEACVRNADVIVTVTFSKDPLVQLDWVQEGAHINAVGAGTTSHHAELAEPIYLSSHVYVDSRAGAETELPGLRKLGVEFKGEIGGLIAGDLVPPPLNQVTVFQGLGMATEDCAMGRLIYDLYKKQSGHS